MAFIAQANAIIGKESGDGPVACAHVLGLSPCPCPQCLKHLYPLLLFNSQMVLQNNATVNSQRKKITLLL